MHEQNSAASGIGAAGMRSASGYSQSAQLPNLGSIMTQCLLKHPVHDPANHDWRLSAHGSGIVFDHLPILHIDACRNPGLPSFLTDAGALMEVVAHFPNIFLLSV